MGYDQFTVMIIEDDPTYRNLLKKLVEERIGARCITCSSSVEGFRYFAHTKPDLIVLDLFLPDMNGIVAVERLRSLDSTKRIPILVCSSHSERETVTCLAAYGVKDFLVKPVNLLTAAQKIKTLLPNPEELDYLSYN